LIFLIIYIYIINYHKWFKELHTDVDLVTIPHLTKLEKLEHQVQLNIIVGSRVVVQYVAKRGNGPRAPHDSSYGGNRINGIAQLRPYNYKRLAKKDKTVSRPYGGVLTGG